MPTLFKCQFVALRSVIVVQCFDGYTWLSIVHKCGTVAITLVPVLLVKRILRSFAISVAVSRKNK